jgi:hypothetical protein
MILPPTLPGGNNTEAETLRQELDAVRAQLVKAQSTVASQESMLRHLESLHGEPDPSKPWPAETDALVQARLGVRDAGSDAQQIGLELSTLRRTAASLAADVTSGRYPDQGKMIRLATDLAGLQTQAERLTGFIMLDVLRRLHNPADWAPEKH